MKYLEGLEEGEIYLKYSVWNFQVSKNIIKYLNKKISPFY